jgi:membrane protein implicated in regulation of membrane protease activity
MNRMGPMILVLAAANAVAAAAMAGAVAAVAIFVGLVAAGFLFLRWQRGGGTGVEHSAEPSPAAGPVGRQAIAMGRQGAWLLVRLDGRDWPARPAAGAAQPGYGDAVRIEAVEGAVLVVRPAPRAIT